MGNCTKCLPFNRDQDEETPRKSQGRVAPNKEYSSEKQRAQGEKKRSPMPKKRAPVSKSGSKSEAPNAVIIDREKTRTEIDEIRESLRSHFILKHLLEENLEVIISNMKFYVLNAKEVIFRRGSIGQNFYIIDSGTVKVMINSNVINTLKKGNSFGELALLHSSGRTATVKTASKCTLWAIDGSTFREALKSMNAVQYHQNKEFIDNLSLFRDLNCEQKDSLLNLFVLNEFADGQTIIREGDRGGLFYIIKDGMVSCKQKGREIRKMGKGECFGEQALLFNTERTATINSEGRSLFLSLAGKDLIDVLGDNLQRIIYRNIAKAAIEMHEVLRWLSPSQINFVVDGMEMTTIEAGDNLENVEDTLWVVLKGVIRSWNSDSEFRVYHTISGSEEYYASVQSILYTIKWETLESRLGGDLRSLIRINEASQALKKVNILRCLSSQTIRTLCSVLNTVDFSDGEAIMKEGEQGSDFYIVKEGLVDIYKADTLIRTVARHDYFGERSILLNEARTATVVAKGEVTCWVLSKQDFSSHIEESIRTQLLTRIELQDETVALSDLLPVRLLGKGTFGNVHLTKHVSKPTYYALKTVTRQKVAAYNMYQSIQLERKLLLQVDHPLIMKVIKTFKDAKRVYFLMEYVRGMELFDVIRVLNVISNEVAQFYIGCIMLILEHLHENNIIYRDLKPENLIVDQDGYAKLIDFGTAKVINERTYTIIGTPHYMAPEIISGRGYGLNSDYWSVGIILYEFLYGFVPFGEEEEDPYTVYEIILSRPLEMPERIKIEPEAYSLIKTLLNKKSSLRGNSASIMKHQWFRNVNFDMLLGKQVTAPYYPPIDSFRNPAKGDLNAMISREEIADPTGKPKSHREEPIGWDKDF